MPPWVRMRPSSTVMLPGPTCFQPVRSLPLNNGFQFSFCGCAANANIAATADTARIDIHLRKFIAGCSSERSSQTGAQQCRAPTKQILEFQDVQIIVTDFDVAKSRFGIVVLDEVMFDAGLAGLREDTLPINGALPDVGLAAAEFNGLAHRSLVSTRRRCVLDPVLDVNEGKAAGIFLEVGEGILAGDADPAEIEFHGHELGIQLGKEKIVGELAAKRCGGVEFERMIVVGELDACFLAGFAGAIEEIDGALPSAGLHALLFVNPGADDVTVADDFRGLQSFRPLFFDDVVADVTGGGGQGVLVEDGADILRRMIEVAGEFDFLVADGCDFGERALEVGFHGVANGVELDADTVDFVRRVRGPGWARGGQSCCDGGADKGASIHERHSTISRRKGNGDLCERGIQHYFLTEGGVVRVSPFPSSMMRKLSAGTFASVSSFPSGQ